MSSVPGNRSTTSYGSTTSRSPNPRFSFGWIASTQVLHAGHVCGNLRPEGKADYGGASARPGSTIRSCGGHPRCPGRARLLHSVPPRNASIETTGGVVTAGLGQRLAVGAGWMVLVRFADRAVGLVSTIILARLLLPSDFGLVALAVSLIALLDVIGELSVELVLIQNQWAERRHYDPPWTL